MQSEETLEELLVPMIVQCQSSGEAKVILQIYKRLQNTNNTTTENRMAIQHLLLNAAFYHLWTKAVGQENYDKAEWEKFRTIVNTNGIAL